MKRLEEAGRQQQPSQTYNVSDTRWAAVADFSDEKSTGRKATFPAGALAGCSRLKDTNARP